MCLEDNDYKTQPKESAAVQTHLADEILIIVVKDKTVTVIRQIGINVRYVLP